MKSFVCFEKPILYSYTLFETLCRTYTFLFTISRHNLPSFHNCTCVTNTPSETCSQTRLISFSYKHLGLTRVYPVSIRFRMSAMNSSTASKPNSLTYMKLGCIQSRNSSGFLFSAILKTLLYLSPVYKNLNHSIH